MAETLVIIRLRLLLIWTSNMDCLLGAADGASRRVLQPCCSEQHLFWEALALLTLLQIYFHLKLRWGEGGGEGENLSGGEWGLSGLLLRARALRDLATPISPWELWRGSCTARNLGSILFLKFLSTCSRHLTTLTDFYQYFIAYVQMFVVWNIQ